MSYADNGGVLKMDTLLVAFEKLPRMTIHIAAGMINLKWLILLLRIVLRLSPSDSVVPGRENAETTQPVYIIYRPPPSKDTGNHCSRIAAATSHAMVKATLSGCSPGPLIEHGKPMY